LRLLLALVLAVPGACAAAGESRTPAATPDRDAAPLQVGPDARIVPPREAPVATGGAAADARLMPPAAPEAGLADMALADARAGDAAIGPDLGAGESGSDRPARAPDAGACMPAPAGATEPGGACAFSACGGDPTGEWTLTAWCEKSYASARGRLTLRADRTFEFVLDHTGANPSVRCLAPQTGTWEVKDSRILFRRSSAGPSFAYSGDVARGAEWYPYCASGDSLKYIADHTRPRWVYVRRR